MAGRGGQGSCWSWVRRGGGGRGGGEGGEEGRRLDERRHASLMKQSSLSAGQSRSLDCLRSITHTSNCRVKILFNNLYQIRSCRHGLGTVGRCHHYFISENFDGG